MRYLFLLLLFISIKISGQSIGGTLNSNTTVCQGTNNGVLSLNGYTGTIQRWELSQNLTGPWTPLVFTGNSYNYVNLTQSTYFRVVVQLTGYAAINSSTVLVSCDLPTNAGVIATNSVQCLNASVVSTLTGNTGSVLSWQYSTNNWISTNTITAANTSVATLPSLLNTTQIRAYVQSGVCPPAYSNTLTVYPAAFSNGGNITGTQSVCATANAATLTLANYTGVVQQWESASSLGGPYNVVAASANTSTLSFLNLAQTTWYRVQVKNADCPPANSATFSVRVDQASDGGSITGTQYVCAPVNTGTLQLIANTGNINHWEYSTNNGINWSLITNSTSVESFSNISSSRIYRALVQNGLCAADFSTVFTVNVNPAPTASFNIMNVCRLATTIFTNVTSGSNTYAWDFGDTGSSTNYQGSHAYASDGNFPVKLTVTSLQGCVDSLRKTITVYPLPVANLVGNDTACFGAALLFNNATTISSGSIASFKINFNDGSPYATVSPVSHLFQNAGSYAVYLKATSNFGCVDSVLKPILIYPKPISEFVASNVCKGAPVLFNNLSLISNGGLYHSWSFGDGNFSSLSSPAYTYTAAGIYSVSLISSSSHNCRDTVYKTITVNERPDLAFTATNACFGTPVVFTASITPSVSNTSTFVNFGDGSTGTTLSAHNYLSPGTFVSSITVVTDSGCVSSATKNITVYAKPFANFNFNNACNADSVKFNNTSTISSGAITFTWNLSTEISTLNSPSVLYPLPGNYLVTLIAKSGFDCFDTITKPIAIFDAPESDFVFSNACNGFPVTFTNLTTVNSGVVSSYLWNFGDNSTSTVVNPSRDYLNNGTYLVALISISSNGCADTITKFVNVYEGPVAKFSAQSQCQNTAITFSNQSMLGTDTYSSSWDFGDQSGSDQHSPAHLYASPGSKHVWLKVTSSNLCSDSTSVFIETYATPNITAGRDTTLDKGFGLRLSASGGTSYNWFPFTGLDNSRVKNPFANPDSSTTYVVEGLDEHGCRGSDTIHVKINDSFLVTPYNILTPDGNGLNDTWIVKNIKAYRENNVVIFDQWNQKVFEAENYENQWEGKNTSGEILPDATYYYILTFKNSLKKYSGYITLIRNK